MAIFLTFAATAQTVTLVAPGLGTVAGGDRVTIRVTSIALVCDPLCAPNLVPGTPQAFVTFGGVSSPQVRVIDTETVEATTPAHAKGTVDVVVSNAAGQKATSAAAFTFAGWGTSPAPVNYERLLVPIPVPSGEVAGANGSRWVAELFVHDRGTSLVEFFRGFPGCLLLCPSCCMGDAPFPNVGPGDTRKIQLDSVPGALVHIQKGRADDLTFALHVRDVSRSAEQAGTEVRVVREREFSTSPIELLNVPIDSSARAALRIFNPSGGGGTAEVRVFALPEDRLVITSQVELRAAPGLNTQWPPTAGYGSIDNLRDALQLPDGRYRIEVRPVIVSAWAYVAVTNNTTQLVTIVRPK